MGRCSIITLCRYTFNGYHKFSVVRPPEIHFIRRTMILGPSVLFFFPEDRFYLLILKRFFPYVLILITNLSVIGDAERFFICRTNIIQFSLYGHLLTTDLPGNREFFLLFRKKFLIVQCFVAVHIHRETSRGMTDIFTHTFYLSCFLNFMSDKGVS